MNAAAQASMNHSAPTIVLLHSSASSARQWDRLAEVLKPQFRVRAIEVHGHGEQQAWRGDAPLTLADEAALALPVLEEAGPVHVVGHSYGAAVAVKLATMYPKSVRSLVAYEPVLFRFLFDDVAHHPAAQDVVAVADAMREQLAAGDNRSAAQTFVDFWSGAGAWDSLPDGKQASIAARMHAVLQHFDALFHEPLQRAAVGFAPHADAIHQRRANRRCHTPSRRASSPEPSLRPTRSAASHGAHGTHHACDGGEPAHSRIPAGARYVRFAARSIDRGRMIIS